MKTSHKSTRIGRKILDLLIHDAQLDADHKPGGYLMDTDAYSDGVLLALLELRRLQREQNDARLDGRDPGRPLHGGRSTPLSEGDSIRRIGDEGGDRPVGVTP